MAALVAVTPAGVGAISLPQVIGALAVLVGVLLGLTAHRAPGRRGSDGPACKVPTTEKQTS